MWFGLVWGIEILFLVASKFLQTQPFAYYAYGFVGVPRKIPAGAYWYPHLCFLLGTIPNLHVLVCLVVRVPHPEQGRSWRPKGTHLSFHVHPPLFEELP